MTRTLPLDALAPTATADDARQLHALMVDPEFTDEAKRRVFRDFGVPEHLIDHAIRRLSDGTMLEVADALEATTKGP